MTEASATTIPSGGPLQARRNTGAGFWASSVAVARRTVRKFARTPQLIVFATLQSVLFLVIFRYTFGGAIDVAGQSYVRFLVPGFVTTTILWAGMGAAVGVAEDVEHGFMDRLRSLPIPRAAVMAGRSLADTALVVWALVVATALGFAVGFRLEGSVAGALAAFGLLILFGFAFEWVFIALGLLGGNAQAAQGLGLLVTPLVFVSSAYVPVDSMPSVMRAFGENQPITLMANAVRALTGGAQAEALLPHSTGYYVGTSLIWAVGIVIVFGLIAALRFSRR